MPKWVDLNQVDDDELLLKKNRMSKSLVLSEVSDAAEAMEESRAMNILPDVKNFEKSVLMALEKEMLGVYISDHPLREFEDKIRKYVSLTSADLADVLENEENGTVSDKVKDGMKARMAGIL